MRTPTVPAGITARPLHMGEAIERADGGVILADSGDVLLHVAIPGGCITFLLEPEEALGVAGSLLSAAREGRRRRARGE